MGGDSVGGGGCGDAQSLRASGSGGMSRSLSWQRGVSKRNKIRPRQRVPPPPCAISVFPISVVSGNDCEVPGLMRRLAGFFGNVASYFVQLQRNMQPPI